MTDNDDLNEPIDVRLEDEAGHETGAVIRVLRAGSRLYLKTCDAQSGRRMRPHQAYGYRAPYYMETPPTPEEKGRETLELLVACTVSWSGVLLDGKALECTPQNVQTLYEKHPLIRKQIDDAVDVSFGMEDCIAAASAQSLVECEPNYFSSATTLTRTATIAAIPATLAQNKFEAPARSAARLCSSN